MTEQPQENVVDLAKQHQWEAPRHEDLKIPEVYITQLKYEIVVLGLKKEFTFRCSWFDKDPTGLWNFENVIIDSSKLDPQGEVELKRLTYHPEVSLSDVPFMVLPVLPAPEEDSATP